MNTLRFASLAIGLLVAASQTAAAAEPARPGDERPSVLAGEYHVVGDEIVHDIARRFGLGYVELLAANRGVSPWHPGNGTVLRLPTERLLPDAPREGIVINLSEQRLYYFAKRGGKPLSFPIGIGREGRQTPLGVTKVVAKRANPVWTVPASIRVDAPWLPRRILPGPDNPLGTHALYLGMEGYLIHGTNKPDGVGRRVSYGCIRLYPEHVRRLFAVVPVGTPVHIVDQPVKAAWLGGELFVEAHPTQEEADLITDGTWPDGAPSRLGDAIALVRRAAGGEADRLDLARVAEVIAGREGIPVQVTRPGEGGLSHGLRAAGALIPAAR